ncbi:MAG: UDP-N-acetylmuramate--L-alanine ligase [Candidatus Acetothermia bacterium]
MLTIDPNNKYHLIGIGGDGMSALARIMLQIGATVVGSDIREDPKNELLRQTGADVYIGHRRSNISRDIDYVVTSSAIPEDNVEVQEARRRKIPVEERLTALGSLMEMKRSLAVAGTHGKTTTTTMVSTLLEYGGKDPTFVIGAESEKLGGNAKVGTGEYIVSEVDESDGHFTELYPDISVVTNVGKDHLDTYKDQDEILNGFRKFVRHSHETAVNVDDSNSRLVLSEARDPLTFAIDRDADITAGGVTQEGMFTCFDLFFRGEKQGKVKLPAPGKHNVYNALAAISLGYKAGLDFDVMIRGLAEFQLPNRRFQVLKNNGMIIVDDYAHLPREIEVTLKAVKEGWDPNRLLTVFQPHRFSRTQHINGQFGDSFELADIVVITEIYPASETPIPGVTSQLIQKSVEKKKNDGVYRIRDKDELMAFISDNLRKGDFLIGLGAGDINEFTEKLAGL